MNFRVTGLSAEPFRHLYGLSDDELAAHGAIRYKVDETPGSPDRIEMRDAEPGEAVLLINHIHQPADSPYRASHAIFVREGAETTYDRINEIPQVMRMRFLSLRGFDQKGMIVEADVADGREIEPIIQRFFANPAIAYIHVHNAAQGCYSGRIDRA